MAPLIKKIYVIFIKYKPSNGTCQNLSPIRLLVYKLQLFKWSYSCKFLKQWKNLNFVCWESIAFWWEKILFKQSNDLISVIWTLLHWKQWLRVGLLTLNTVMQTNDAERSDRPNSAVVQEITKNLHKLVLANHKLKLCEKATATNEEEKVLFQQENALCHKSIVTKAKLHELPFRLLLHLPYSSDLAPSDYWLFADLKECSKKRDLAPMKKQYQKLRRILRPKTNHSTKKVSSC